MSQQFGLIGIVVPANRLDMFLAEVPLDEQHCHLSQVYRDAALGNLDKDPLKAAALFYKAWWTYPRRVGTLVRAVMSFIFGLAFYALRSTPSDGSTKSENEQVN
jgi:hypothetical protein